jgi:flagellar protein FliS
MNTGLSAYRQVGASSGVQDADPHRLIQMLLQGLMDDLRAAEGHVRGGDMEAKVRHIGRAMDIIETLRASLDFNAGDLSENLDALYEYMGTRLTESNASNRAEGIAEVAALLTPIKQAWDEIRPQLQSAPSAAEEPVAGRP